MINFAGAPFPTDPARLTVENIFLNSQTVSGNLFISGSGIFNSRITVNNTGVVLSGEAATLSNLSSTGSILNSKIDNLSGYVNSTNSNIVFTTGDQAITGIKNFNNPPQVNGSNIYFQKNVIYFTGNNFTPDYSLGRVFEYVLTGLPGAVATLNIPVNMDNGENIVIKIQQSASGANNIQFNSAFKFPGSIYPSLTLEPNRIDIYTILKIGDNFYSTYVKDFPN